MKGILKIIGYIKPYKFLAFLNVLFNVLSSFAELFTIALIIPFLKLLFNPNELVKIRPDFSFNFKALTNLFMYHLSNVITENGPQAALGYICLILGIAITSKNIFRYLGSYFMVPLRTRVVADMRNSLYQHILILPLAYFSDERRGDLITRMSNDAKEIEVSIMSTLEALFKEPISIFISLIALIWISPFLTFTVLLLLPVIGLLLSRVNRKLRRQTIHGQQKLDELMSLFEETLTGVRIIKAFSSQAFFNGRFKKQNELFTRSFIHGNRLLDAASPISETVGVLIMAFVLFMGGRMVLSESDNLTAEAFLGFIAIFSRIIPPVTAFSTAFSKAQKGLVSISRIEEVLKSEEIITEVSNAKNIASFNGSIEFKNVSFSYNNEPVLKNINLKIEKGKTVALVGPSGAGKSTLTDLIPRFYDPTEGVILLDGIDIRQYKILQLRRLLGIVTQESILFNDTIYNNIAFGKENVTTEQIENAAKTANAHSFILETENGYQTNIGDRGNKLSGGQKQRISIARAVNTDPAILILDEATSSLDTTSERLVQDALSNVMKGRTTVVIAHRLSTIVNADLIVVLRKGEIVQTGTHLELLQQPGLYKELHDMQKLAEL
jgi:subfamily B ATP-binding cassette protein MsbA